MYVLPGFGFSTAAAGAANPTEAIPDKPSAKPNIRRTVISFIDASSTGYDKWRLARFAQAGRNDEPVSWSFASSEAVSNG